MKTHINDLHLHELLQFCSDLKYLSSSPQVDLLLKGAAFLVNINGTEPISTLTPVEAVIMMYVFGSHSDIDPGIPMTNSNVHSVIVCVNILFE